MLLIEFINFLEFICRKYARLRYAIDVVAWGSGAARKVERVWKKI